MHVDRIKFSSFLLSQIYSGCQCTTLNERCIIGNKYKVIGNCTDEMFPLYELKRVTRLASESHRFDIELARCSRHVYFNSFFRFTSGPWNFLPISRFVETYNILIFKC